METARVINGTFHIIKEIGSGSGGTVFLAYHNNLEKQVVLKKITSRAKELLESTTEMNVLKNLHFNYLPQVYDFIRVPGENGEEDIYTVMEYIPGKSFEDYLKEGRQFTATQTAKYMKQLCEAVNYLHTQKIPIIHGDIKPANLMLTPDDDIYLIDFNVAGFTNSMEVIAYTKGYAPPEQRDAAIRNGNRKKQLSEMTNLGTMCSKRHLSVNIEETMLAEETQLEKEYEFVDNDLVCANQRLFVEVAMIDQRADIFSVGATMYSILTGKKPDSEYENQIPVGKMNLKVSEGLAYIIDKAMSLDPKDRFQSAEEMLHAITILGKKDKRYKNLLVRQTVVCVALVVCMATSSVVSYIGHQKMQREIAEMHHTQALTLYENREYEESLAYILKEALADESVYDKGTLGNLYYIAASSSFETEQYEAATDFYKKAIIYNDLNSEYYCNYAIALARLGKIEESMAVIDEAAQKGIEEAQIYLMKGELFLAEGNEEKAKESFVSCIQKTSDEYVRTRAYILYSEVFRKNEMYLKNQSMINSDIQILQEAVSVIADEYIPLILERLAEAYMNMSNVTADTQYTQKAIGINNQVIEMGWESFNTHMNLAMQYEVLGQFAESRQVYDQLLEKYGENYIVYKRMAFLELNQQNSFVPGKREYGRFEQYYVKAFELLEQAGKQIDSDMEMMLLKENYKTLEATGWI